MLGSHAALHDSSGANPTIVSYNASVVKKFTTPRANHTTFELTTTTPAL
jgi:hypothetical protein